MASHLTQSKVLTPREVIEEIRQRYRVGETIDESDPYHEIARGTVPLVTDELYESNTHFFSELLQNADDNEFPPDENPELVIAAYQDRIEVTNNEVGFRPEHVRAICSLAKSTKRDRKESSTGEKGIGFKAVFQASDTPEVHSNGFHFRFDKKRDPIFGMVIPEWIDVPELTSNGTRIVLPLDKAYRLPNDFLKSLQPELLLFLRRIRRLAFRDFDYGHEVTLVRRDDGPIAVVTRTVKDDVEPSRSSETQFAFYLHKRRVTMDHIDEPRRRQITATEVAVALPLNSKTEVDANSSRRGLFAFLPVKTAELPFLCHGDFVLSTSREAIQEDLAWNQAIRDALGACLADCVSACRTTSIGATGLRCLVDPSGVQDKFLRPIMADAIGFLKETPCVPVVKGKWSKPEASIAADAGGLWKLLQSDEYPQLLDRHLVDPEIDGIGIALRLLGVPSFRLKDLAGCLEDEAWRSSRGPDWWASCYSTLGSMKVLSNAERSLLDNAPLFPLTSGVVARRCDTRLFRQLSTKGTYGFEHALSILESRVLQACSKSQREHFEAFLQQLKVHDATPTRVIDDYIVPLHCGDEWNSCGDSILAAHLLYVRDHLDQYLSAKDKAGAQALQTLQSSLRIKTTGSTVGSPQYEHADDLYLGRAYRDMHDIEAIFEGIEDSRVSPIYLNLAPTDDADRSCQEWRQLLVKLGARQIPTVRQSAGGTDYLWPDEVLGSLRDSASDRQWRLLQLISDNWAYYGQWKNRPRQGLSPSSMLSALRDSLVMASEQRVLLCTCYLDNEDNRTVFGDSVPLLRCEWPEAFCDAVGTVRRPTVGNAIQRLQSLKASDCTDRAAVEPIYKFLDARFAKHGEEICQRLEDEDLILANHGDSLAWLAPSQVRWSVPKQLRQYASTGSLSAMWRDLQGFFVERVGVEKELVADDLVDILQVLSESEEDSDMLGKAVARIYRELANAVKLTAESDSPEWLNRLRNGFLVYTRSNKWWQNDDNIFIDDDPVLSQLFEDEPSVAFLAVPPDSFTQLRPLLNALDIGALSEVIETKVPADITTKSWPQLDALWQERYRLVVRFLHHKHPSLCDKAVKEGTLVALRGMDALVCRPLELIVTLRELSVRHRFQANIARDEGRLTLFIDEQSKSDWTRVGIEIGKLVGLQDSESVTIGQLLSEPLDRAESLLATLKIAELPDELRKQLFGEHVDDWLEASSGDDEAEASNEPSPTQSEDVGELIPEDQELCGDHVEAPVPDSTPEMQAHQPSMSLGKECSADGLGDQQPQEGEGESESASEQSADDTTCEKRNTTASRNGVPNLHEGSQQSSDDDPEKLEPSDNSSFASATPAQESAVKVYSNSRSRPGGSGFAFERYPISEADDSGHGAPIEPNGPGSARESDRLTSSDNRERLRSYVEPERSDKDNQKQSERKEVIKAIESAAIEFVLAEERRLGRVARDLNADSQHSRGHDVLSHLPDGTDERYIEVKGVAGAWGQRGVMVTPAQFECALQNGDKAWLYVIEHALSAPKLHRIQDFARRVWRFGFDEGWGGVAESASEKKQRIDADVLPAPAPGMRVVLTDGQRGVVEEVKNAGRLLGVIVKLESGESVQTCWVPDEVRAVMGGF